MITQSAVVSALRTAATTSQTSEHRPALVAAARQALATWEAEKPQRIARGGKYAQREETRAAQQFAYWPLPKD